MTPLPPGQKSRAFVGLLTVVMATPIAVLFVPDVYAPAGALFLPALILAAGLIGPGLLASLWNPKEAIRASQLLLCGVVYFILFDLLQMSYDLEVGRPAVVIALVMIGMFGAGVRLGELSTRWQVPGPVWNVASLKLSADVLFRLGMFGAFLALFRFAYPCDFNVAVMFEGLLGGRWDAPWARGDFGGIDAFLDHLQYFGYVLPALVVLLSHASGSWVSSRVLILAGLTALVLLFLVQGGGRRIVGATVGSAMLTWMLLQPKIHLKGSVGLAAVCFGLLLFFQIMVETRGRGFAVLLEEEIGSSYQHFHVDDNFLRLAQVIEIIPEKHPHTYERVFVWAAIRPVPRYFWPGKPIDHGFNLPEMVGKTGVSLSCSVVGELYMSYGWVTVLFGGWFFGSLATMCQGLIGDRPLPSGCLAFAVGVMALFIGIRSLIELVLMSYMLLVWLFLVLLFRPRKSADSS